MFPLRTRPKSEGNKSVLDSEEHPILSPCMPILSMSSLLEALSSTGDWALNMCSKLTYTLDSRTISVNMYSCPISNGWHRKFDGLGLGLIGFIYGIIWWHIDPFSQYPNNPNDSHTQQNPLPYPNKRTTGSAQSLPLQDVPRELLWPALLPMPAAWWSRSQACPPADGSSLPASYQTVASQPRLESQVFYGSFKETARGN